MIKIQKNSQNFKKIVQKELISKLNKQNQNIAINLEFIQNSGFLKEIEIIGIDTVETFNLITSKIIELVSLESGSGANAKIERNFYSEENNLLCNVKYLDFDRVLIDFLSPDVQKIKKTDEKFEEYFIERILKPIKKESQNLKVVYNFHEGKDILGSIELIGIKSIEKFNFITSNLVNLW